MGNAYVVPADLMLTVVYLPSLDSLERHFKGPAYLPKSHFFLIEEMQLGFVEIAEHTGVQRATASWCFDEEFLSRH